MRGTPGAMLCALTAKEWLHKIEHAGVRRASRAAVSAVGWIADVTTNCCVLSYWRRAGNTKPRELLRQIRLQSVRVRAARG